MSLRVLIIDDNKDFAHILTQALALSGHRADQAYDGFEGIQKAKDLLPDVILCDIGLPNMDGFNVAGSIRNDSTLEDTIIIALTGYASPNDLSRALNAGFNYHITKPVDLAALSEILSSIAQTNQKQLTE